MLTAEQEPLAHLELQDPSWPYQDGESFTPGSHSSFTLLLIFLSTACQGPGGDMGVCARQGKAGAEAGAASCLHSPLRLLADCSGE